MIRLKDVVVNACNEVATYFNEYNFESLPENQFPSKEIQAAWKGIIICKAQRIPIIVAIPQAFPDELPKIYLTEEFHYFPIPHVDERRFVCTYNTDQTVFFHEYPIRLIKETIEKARIIITNGITGKNADEFEDEFLPYWANGSSCAIYSILKPRQEKSIVYLATVKSAFSKIEKIVGNTEDELITCIHQLDSSSQIINTKKCLYLPFNRVPIPPFPATFGEIYELVEELYPLYEKDIAQFLSSNNNRGHIIFVSSIKGSFVFGAWYHENRKEEKTLTKGFRHSKVSLNVLKARLASQKIHRINVERIDTDRLLRRIGTDNEILSSKRVCIIGCGAIGSNMAFLLAKSGITDLMLIDDDVLKPENVARHLCGMSDVNYTKSHAVAKRLQGHFPLLNVQPLEQNFHEALIKNPYLFKGIDLIISATGNTAQERRLNHLQKETNYLPAVLYTWIEPYGIAGHAVLIVRGNGGCFECCLNPHTLAYRFSVGTFNPRERIIREAGCQTAVTPYSALDADQSSSMAARLSLSFLKGEIVSSTRCVWVGDYCIKDQKNFTINSFYDDIPIFSIQKYYLEKRKDCHLCNVME